MSVFPVLKTGAVAQYPSDREVMFRTQVVEFLDGSSQRYREWKAPLRRWTIRFELLDENELASVFAFFEQNSPSASFAFADPWDGTIYPTCMLDGGRLSLEWSEYERGRTTLIVKEVRT